MKRRLTIAVAVMSAISASCVSDSSTADKTLLTDQDKKDAEAEIIYQRGHAFLEAGEYSAALKEALKAADIARENGDRLAEAKAHELMADIYRDNINLKSARSHRMTAAEAYEESGHDENAFFAMIDLAGEYSHEDNDSSYIVMDKAYRMLKDYPEKVADFYRYCYADICRVREDYDKALDHISEIPEAALANMLTSEDSVHVGEIFYWNGMTDRAMRYFSTSATDGNVQYLYCMSDLAEKKGNPGEALRLRKEIGEIEHQKTGESLSNALELEERNYFAEKARKAEESRRRLIGMICIAIGILTAIVLGALARRYYRKTRRLSVENDIKDIALMASNEPQSTAEMNHAHDEADASKAVDGTSPTKETDDERWINVLLDFYMQRLNAISKEYFKATDEARVKEIEEEFARELKSLRGSDVFVEIERRINERHDDIADRLRRQYPKFNEQYIRLMLCHLAGLSSQSTCMLLSIEKGNYYVMWTRIRAKIKESQVPDKDEFVRLFCKK